MLFSPLIGFIFVCPIFKDLKGEMSMEIKNFIKSLAILGLLAGVTDADAAKVGSDPQEKCHVLIVENNSHESKDVDSKGNKVPAYYIEANFVPCNDQSGKHVLAIIRPLSETNKVNTKTFCVKPGSDLWMERRTSTKTDEKGTTHLPGTKTTINAGWHYICTGSHSDDLAACHRVEEDKNCPEHNDNENLN
jgi:hypothetical protein